MKRKEKMFSNSRIEDLFPEDPYFKQLEKRIAKYQVRHPYEKDRSLRRHGRRTS